MLLLPSSIIIIMLVYAVGLCVFPNAILSFEYIVVHRVKQTIFLITIITINVLKLLSLSSL